MTCEQISELLPDYFRRSLNSGEIASIDSHIEQCVECREHVILWKELSSLGDEQPSPRLRQRFETMLNAFQEGRWEHEKLKAARMESGSRWGFLGWFQSPLAQMAVIAICVLGGFAAGRFFHGSDERARELAAVHGELSKLRQDVVLLGLQQPSATDRLQGVSYSTRVDRPDPEVLSALLQTLQRDSSVDVRLAALDALRRYHNQPQVRQGLIAALSKQKSPMVQIALIDALVEFKEAGAVSDIKKFQKDPNVIPAVRQRAEWGINQLSRG